MSGNASDGTEREFKQPYQDSQYEQCDVCEGPVNVFNANYYKSHNDEKFRHILCHENGEPPEGYVFELTDTDKCCTNRQYNCGHTVYAPQTDHPYLCPECSDLEYVDGEWTRDTGTEQ